jgi:hypothetical protein
MTPQRRHPRGAGQQGGQAMVELLAVAAFVLLPLFYAMPMLGKYLDVRATAIASARYVAWERTVWSQGSLWGGDHSKGDDALAAELTARIWSRDGGAFDSQQDAQAKALKKPPHLWRTRDGQALLRPYDAHEVALSNKTAPGTFNKLLDLMPGAADEAKNDSGESDWFEFPFKIDAKGRYDATVSMAVRDVDAGPGLRQGAGPWLIAESHGVLANGWQASGPSGDSASVKTMVKGLVPLAWLDSGVMGKVVDGVQNGLSVFGFYELNSRSLELGKIDPDLVPYDRLGSAP